MRRPRPYSYRNLPRSFGLMPTLLLLLLLVTPLPLVAQRAPFDYGVTAAGLLLRQLDGVKRVLMIGAHPDDEDTALLTALARGMGAETAYLSLTRGEGGQNLIGGELFEGLGAIRTGELLAARSLDGGRQFFTRAVDYGFSKNADEAFSKWPRQALLHDVVWVVRNFRPQVIVSVFGGTPADGHGQHQAAGILAREAFDAAGDPGRFPEQLQRGVGAWKPTLLYTRTRGPDSVDVSVETGRYDPLLGRSHFQLAMESRTQHQSQEMGQAQPMGTRASNLTLLRSVGSARGPDAGLFTGVDTTLAALAERLPPGDRAGLLEHAAAYRAEVRAAAGALGALEPWGAAPALGRALDHLAEMRLYNLGFIGASTSASAPGVATDVELGRLLWAKMEVASRALLETAGVVVDVQVTDDLVIPGQELGVTVQLWNGGPFTISGVGPALILPEGWALGGSDVEAVGAGARNPPAAPGEPPATEPGVLRSGEVLRWTYRVTAPSDQPVSELYYLQSPQDGDLYTWPEDAARWSLPKDPPLLQASVSLTLHLPSPAGEQAVATSTLRPAEFVGVDGAHGEFRRPLLVVPEVSVAVDPETLIWPLNSRPRTVGVSVASQRAGGPAVGTLTLEAPEGWTVTPASFDFSLASEGTAATFDFQVLPAAGAPPGRYALRAAASAPDGRVWLDGFRVLDYPHIEPVALFRPAEVGVTVVPVQVAEGLRVGYVMGSGDQVPEALDQLGVEVELLGPEAVAEADLSEFDALVLGIRTYETRPDLAAANERVLDFARRGGTVVVQYNQYEYPEGGFAPYPVEISRPHDRVTDELAAVRFLDAEAPVLVRPNRIAAEDFEGWITERGLYFLGEWDPRYVPVLAMADPGEEPLLGSLLVASVGEGVYVYTGLSFFRQLPAGVPGAYRLFANLVSLRAQDWARHARAR